MLNDEAEVAKIAESAAAVGLPRHVNAIIDFQVLRLDVLAGHTVGAAFRRDVFQKPVQVFEPDELRQDVKCALAGTDGAVHVTPYPFQGGGADDFVGVFPDGSAEEVKISGGPYLATDVCFDSLERR